MATAQNGFAPLQRGELEHSQVNNQKLTKLHSVVDTILREALVRGFHGMVTVRFTVQDGTIQLIEDCVERKHR